MSGTSDLKDFLKSLLATAGLAMLAGIGGCATGEPEVAYTPPPPPPPIAMVPAPPPPSPPPPAVGTTRGRHTTATWYGPGFNGHETSTGERFNENEMTAASKTLPIGSHIVVKNPQNGRSVTVRINDRIPRGHGHSLDLSKGAAQELGITKKGVARVEVRTTGHKTRRKKPVQYSPPTVPESVQSPPEATQSKPASESNI